MTAAAFFFDTVLPDLVAQDRLVILTSSPPTIYVRGMNDRLQLLTNAVELANNVSVFVEPPAAMDEKEGAKYVTAAVQGAKAAWDVHGHWLAKPELTVDTLITRPSILWHDRAGQYVSPAPGRDLAIRVYSTAAQLQPVPIEPGASPLHHFFTCLCMTPEARARALAFYAGCLLRPAFDVMPGMLVRSPYKNTGKSTIMRLAGMLAADTPHPAVHLWRNNTEFEKTLGAQADVDAQVSMILLDNVCPYGGFFQAPVIAMATYNSTVQTRRLGVSRLITVDRPIVAITMQGGLLDSDLVDRFLYVELTERPPTDTTGEKDMKIYAQDRYRDIRDEIVSLIFQTRPLSKGTAIPNRFRYGDFYRFVAPVVEKFGLDPALITTTGTAAASAELVELAKAVSCVCDETDENRWFSPRELIDLIKWYRYPRLAAAVPENENYQARTQQLAALLGNLQPKIHGPEHTLVVERKRTAQTSSVYRVSVEATEKEDECP